MNPDGSSDVLPTVNSPRAFKLDNDFLGDRATELFQTAVVLSFSSLLLLHPPLMLTGASLSLGT